MTFNPVLFKEKLDCQYTISDIQLLLSIPRGCAYATNLKTSFLYPKTRRTWVGTNRWAKCKMCTLVQLGKVFLPDLRLSSNNIGTRRTMIYRCAPCLLSTTTTTAWRNARDKQKYKGYYLYCGNGTTTTTTTSCATLFWCAVNTNQKGRTCMVQHALFLIGLDKWKIGGKKGRFCFYLCECVCCV